MPWASQLASCPRAQMIDEAVVFGDRDEHVGRDHAVAVFPAHQRLHGADFAGGGPHDGLVVEQELAVLHGFEHALLDAELFVEPVREFGRVDAVAVLALCLGLVHGKVGMLEQL
jgi:hypothetical protein